MGKRIALLALLGVMVIAPPAWASHPGNTYNCPDFDSAQELQDHVDAHPEDQDDLDRDDDGESCDGRFSVAVIAQTAAAPVAAALGGFGALWVGSALAIAGARRWRARAD